MINVIIDRALYICAVFDGYFYSHSISLYLIKSLNQIQGYIILLIKIFLTVIIFIVTGSEIIYLGKG
ncbi:hypothetical protein J2Z35_002459 [Acetoanaerobium pronyense]|uniref:Uncharacterized protein n=1 Tax=Acetoanaerobium pronyense TaxID=1482736 RepID=A0ABS4KLH7_9FIRM|nr:hypothetical protein [Acetoanaerobium pronyense]MBP2028629.1 hypothetical protein [Acetoanaerobium pronyense]